MALNARPRQPAEVADRASAASTPAGEPLPEPARPCIALDRVSLRFRSERGEVQALSDISLSVGGGRVRRAARADRLRQEFAAAARQRSHSADLRHDRGARRRSLRRRATSMQFGFVFQEPALLSWRTAIGNVRLPLEVVGYPPEQRVTRCEDLLDSVGLLKFKDAYPARTLRRHEAARGDRARARLESVDPADGRAVQRARRAHARPVAGRSAAAVEPRAQDRAVRHPQYFRSDLSGRPRRGDVAASRPYQDDPVARAAAPAHRGYARDTSSS